MMTGATLCSGIGAPEQAMPWVEWQWCAETEKFPSAVLAARFDHPNLGDITAPDFIDRALSLKPPDLLIAGTPCQSFSIAGLRRSLADDRGNITLRFVEIVNAINPPVVLWENVPGVLNTKDNAFGCFLAGIVGASAPLVPARGRRWSHAGMVDGPKARAAWRILDAQYFGLAQRRKRVFVVRCPRDGTDPSEILFECEGVRRDTPPMREARETTAGNAGQGVEVGPSGGRFTELAPTLDARCKDSAIRNQIGLLVFGGNNAAGPINIATACNAHGGSGRLDFETETFVTHALRGNGFDTGEDGTGRSTPIIPIAFNLRGREGGADGPREITGWAVRRLTPRECERLQGFPDDYTLIHYRGKPAADGPRYRAIGNSMAVPVMRWIGERIRRVVAGEKIDV